MLVHRRVTPAVCCRYPFTHLDGVKFLVQETTQWQGLGVLLNHRPSDLKSNALTTTSPYPHGKKQRQEKIIQQCLLSCNRKRARKQQSTKSGQGLGLKGRRSMDICALVSPLPPPPPPPPTIYLTLTVVANAVQTDPTQFISKYNRK